MGIRISAREDGNLDIEHDGSRPEVSESMYAVVDEGRGVLLGCTIDGRVLIGDLPRGYRTVPNRQHHVFLHEHKDGEPRCRALPVVS